MPQLDVSFVLDDPMFRDTCTVTRRVEAIGANGRTTQTPTVIANVGVVVTQSNPAELMRMPDGQTLPRRIFIASKFPFVSQAPNRTADVLAWNNTDYVVMESQPYSRYGAGHYQVIAEYQDAVPPLQ